MKRIRKTHPPKVLRDWFEENKYLDCSYDALVGKPAHVELKKHLIKEQGFLCAYTGRAVDENNSHVEHLKPRKKCVGNEDIEYHNMVACFPFNGGDQSYGYGAPIKAGWWDETLFISPLYSECERRFAFSWSGRIQETPKNHAAAKKTIAVLGLSHKNLVHLRKKAVDGFFGFGARTKQLSKQKASRLLRVIDKLNASGKLTPYCFMLKSLLEKYIA